MQQQKVHNTKIEVAKLVHKGTPIGLRTINLWIKRYITEEFSSKEEEESYIFESPDIIHIVQMEMMFVDIEKNGYPIRGNYIGV